ncbi:MAG: hypothetical protein ACK514_04355 [Bacteroidota bacterium]|jgi:hypothetical protein|nr:hypothetical protein [Cytophagales bacterium]MCE2957634.1 hypothetical protein [Flammeovirgaceae bacterium]
MKTTIRFLNVLLVGWVFAFSGCLKEKFVPDNDIPSIPKYTEEGNQVGGALVNKTAWKTNFAVNFDGPTRRSFYFTNHSKGDSVTIHLDGIFNEGTKKDKPLNFQINLKGTQIKNIDDLMQWKGKVFSLDAAENQAACIDFFRVLNDQYERYYGGKGQFIVRNVKRVTNLTYVRGNGEKYNPLIVSGIFDYEFANYGIKVESGRFDFQMIDADIDFK